MMYAKLALRNVKRSAKDYLIYVITLILSVGLFYGFMSIASPYYNESLPVKINLEILNKAMRIAVPIVALLVVFLISYVNTYMLRRKQKEFAVQTIIGMEQRTVAFIFFVETMIMGAISIIFGILLGIGLSQIVGYIVVQSFGVEWQPYLEMSRNVQSGNTQNLKSMVIQRSFPKWSVAERRKTAAASNQAACCACTHSRYLAGGSPSGLRV